MICNNSDIYFPRKKLKEVLPTEVFAFSPTGSSLVRVGLNSDYSVFMLMDLDHNNCYYPKEADMEKDVYMLQAVVHIAMLEKKPNKKGH